SSGSPLAPGFCGFISAPSSRMALFFCPHLNGATLAAGDPRGFAPAHVPASPAVELRRRRPACVGRGRQPRLDDVVPRWIPAGDDGGVRPAPAPDPHMCVASAAGGGWPALPVVGVGLAASLPGIRIAQCLPDLAGALARVARLEPVAAPVRRVLGGPRTERQPFGAANPGCECGGHLRRRRRPRGLPALVRPRVVADGSTAGPAVPDAFRRTVWDPE